MKRILSRETLMLTALVLGILLAANALLGIVLTGQSRTAMKTMLQTRMLDVSNTAASMLDGDKLKALKAEDKGKPDYQKINDTLTYFQNSIELEYIYCIQPIGDKKFVFSVDPTVEDPGDFGAPIVYTDALYNASLGTPSVDEEAYSDAWGRFYSAYSPVFGSDGKVAGIVAVDFSAQWYEDEIAKQTRTIYICMAISTVLCIFLVLAATSSLRRKLESMTSNLNHLAQDLDEITFEMAGASMQEAHHQASHNSSSSLDDLNERIRAIKEGLHRYWEDSRSKTDNIVAALGSNYRNVYYLKPDRDMGICYKSLNQDCGLTPGQTFPFESTMKKYARAYVTESNREGFLQFMSIENISHTLKTSGQITHLYKVKREELESYEIVRMTFIRSLGSRDEREVPIGVGIAQVDDETGKLLAQSRSTK